MSVASITRGAVLAVVLAGGIATVAQAQQQTLRITSWGGSFQDAQRKAFFKPFEEATGIKIIEDTWQGNIGQIRAMVESKNPSSDLFDANPNDVITACDEGIAEPIDKSFIKDPSDFSEGALTDCGIGTDIWAHVWAWDGDRLPKDKGPKNIADVFDNKKFPGRRGMPRRIYGIAEQALLADGVPVKDIYKVLATPEGLDRVFKKLDPLKKDIVWWTANPQAVQLLADNEVQFVVVPSSHWYGAVTRENQPRNFIPMWDGQIYSYDMWMMPRGTANKALAMKYLDFIIQPKQLANFAEYSSYAPATKSGMDVVKPEIRRTLATANATNPIRIDRVWWADHMDSYTKRFEAWLQQ
jgi:putative spermidine/putrescine transport system substrate-binding protein